MARAIRTFTGGEDVGADIAMRDRMMQERLSQIGPRGDGGRYVYNYPGASPDARTSHVGGRGGLDPNIFAAPQFAKPQFAIPPNPRAGAEPGGGRDPMTGQMTYGYQMGGSVPAPRGSIGVPATTRPPGANVPTMDPGLANRLGSTTSLTPMVRTAGRFMSRMGPAASGLLNTEQTFARGVNPSAFGYQEGGAVDQPVVGYRDVSQPTAAPDIAGGDALGALQRTEAPDVSPYATGYGGPRRGEAFQAGGPVDAHNLTATRDRPTPEHAFENIVNRRMIIRAAGSGNRSKAKRLLQGLRREHTGLRMTAAIALARRHDDHGVHLLNHATTKVPDGSHVHFQKTGPDHFVARVYHRGQHDHALLNRGQMLQYATGPAGGFDHTLDNGVHKNLHILTTVSHDPQRARMGYAGGGDVRGDENGGGDAIAGGTGSIELAPGGIGEIVKGDAIGMSPEKAKKEIVRNYAGGGAVGMTSEPDPNPFDLTGGGRIPKEALRAAGYYQAGGSVERLPPREPKSEPPSPRGGAQVPNLGELERNVKQPGWRSLFGYQEGGPVDYRQQLPTATDVSATQPPQSDQPPLNPQQSDQDQAVIRDVVDETRRDHGIGRREEERGEAQTGTPYEYVTGTGPNAASTKELADARDFERNNMPTSAGDFLVQQAQARQRESGAGGELGVARDFGEAGAAGTEVAANINEQALRASESYGHAGLRGAGATQGGLRSGQGVTDYGSDVYMGPGGGGGGRRRARGGGGGGGGRARGGGRDRGGDEGAAAPPAAHAPEIESGLRYSPTGEPQISSEGPAQGSPGGLPVQAGETGRRVDVEGRPIGPPIGEPVPAAAAEGEPTRMIDVTGRRIGGADFRPDPNTPEAWIQRNIQPEYQPAHRALDFLQRSGAEHDNLRSREANGTLTRDDADRLGQLTKERRQAESDWDKHAEQTGTDKFRDILKQSQIDAPAAPGWTKNANDPGMQFRTNPYRQEIERRYPMGSEGDPGHMRLLQQERDWLRRNPSGFEETPLSPSHSRQPLTVIDKNTGERLRMTYGLSNSPQSRDYQDLQRAVREGDSRTALRLHGRSGNRRNLSDRIAEGEFDVVPSDPYGRSAEQQAAEGARRWEPWMARPLGTVMPRGQSNRAPQYNTTMPTPYYDRSGRLVVPPNFNYPNFQAGGPVDDEIEAPYYDPTSGMPMRAPVQSPFRQPPPEATELVTPRGAPTAPPEPEAQVSPRGVQLEPSEPVPLPRPRPAEAPPPPPEPPVEAPFYYPKSVTPGQWPGKAPPIRGAVGQPPPAEDMSLAAEAARNYPTASGLVHPREQARIAREAEERKYAQARELEGLKGQRQIDVQQMKDDASFRNLLVKLESDAQGRGETNRAKLLATVNAAIRSPEGLAQLDPRMQEWIWGMFQQYRIEPQRAGATAAPAEPQPKGPGSPPPRGAPAGGQWGPAKNGTWYYRAPNGQFYQ